MTFQSQGLSEALRRELDAFVACNSLADFYREYTWGNDSYADGFPDIYRLETRIAQSSAAAGITIDDVREIALWGAMRNQGRIQGTGIALVGTALLDAAGTPQAYLEHHPEMLLCALSAVSGLGPTYQSKVLRFAMPQEYGAIDTRCVRVFGEGDPDSQKHRWLNLRASRWQSKGKKTPWSIPETQSKWPAGYRLWINILRYIARKHQSNCPHPAKFVNDGLRRKGEWTPADVEMALFAYATGILKGIIDMRADAR